MTQEVLTKDQVISIFQRSVISSAKKQTATSVAKEFGVSEKTVRDIWKGRTWYEETLPLDLNRVPREPKKMGRPPGRKDRTKRKLKTNAGQKAISTQSSAVRSDLNGILQSHEKDTVQATSSTQLADSAQTSTQILVSNNLPRKYSVQDSQMIVNWTGLSRPVLSTQQADIGGLNALKSSCCSSRNEMVKNQGEEAHGSILPSNSNSHSWTPTSAFAVLPMTPPTAPAESSLAILAQLYRPSLLPQSRLEAASILPPGWSYHGPMLSPPAAPSLGRVAAALLTARPAPMTSTQLAAAVCAAPAAAAAAARLSFPPINAAMTCRPSRTSGRRPRRPSASNASDCPGPWVHTGRHSSP